MLDFDALYGSTPPNLSSSLKPFVELYFHNVYLKSLILMILQSLFFVISKMFNVPFIFISNVS